MFHMCIGQLLEPNPKEKNFKFLSPLQGCHGGLLDSRFRTRHDVLPTLKPKEMWPLNECVFYVQIQAAKTGLFWQFIG